MSATGEGSAGFTLIEMLVVLAVLGLIGGLVYPALARGARAQALAAATATVTALLREAHGRALRLGRPVGVSVAPGGLGLADGALRPLPAAVRFAIAPARGIVFYPDGSSSGGAVALWSGDRAADLTVSPASGLIRIER